MRRNITILLVACLMLVVASCKSKKKPQSASADVAGFSSELKKRIEDTIEDDAVVKRLLFLVDESDRRMAEHSKAITDFRELYKNDPQIERSELDKLFAQHADTRIGFVRDIAKLRVEMRTYVNQEQWEAIFAVDDEEKQAGNEEEPPTGDGTPPEEAAEPGDEVSLVAPRAQQEVIPC